MFKTKIMFRLIFMFLIFAIMIVVPYSLTILNKANKLIMEEERIFVPVDDESTDLHREFVPALVEEMLPYAIYIPILAFMLSIFFMRMVLISLKELQRGSQALKDGDLDIKLEIISDDELGDVTRAFNEMAASLREKTLELQKKDVYINAMFDPLWVVDEANDIVDINPAFTRLLGYTREDAVGASIYDFFDEKNKAIMRYQLEEKREKGIASIYEISIFTKDGSSIPVLISGAPIYSGDRMAGKIGIMKDFREHSELTNALQQSRDYIETIMDSILDELIVIDRDYKIVKANKVAVLNSKGIIIGKFCYGVANDMNRTCRIEAHECPVKSVFITGENYRATHKHITASGDTRFYEIVANPIKDSSGNVLNVIELCRDVTKRVKHEEEISEKNRELVTLNSIAGFLSRSLRPDEIFTNVLDEMIEMMKMNGGGIFFLDENMKELVCQYHRGASDEHIRMLGRVRLGDDIPGKVAATGEIMTSSDLSKDHNVERTMIKHSGIRGYCCIPIRGKERILGVFYLFSFRTHFFTVEEENILYSIGEMTGIALENIRLYEEMRQLYEYQRKRREDEHKQLLSLSTKLGSSIELKDVMVNVLELLKNFFRANFIWLLVNDNDGNFILKAEAPLKRMENEIVYQKGISSIEGYSMEKKRPTIIQNIRSEEKFFISPEIAGLSYQTAIAVPMFIGEKPVGVFTLYYLGAKDFKEEEIHFLQIIANILAVSIERSDFYIRAIMGKGLSDTILQSVADAVITFDNNGKAIEANRAFERIAGIPSDDAVGLQVSDIFKFNRYADSNKEFQLLLAECLDAALSGKSAGKEGVFVTAYGKKMPVLISSDPVLAADGRVTGAVNLLRDISREKEIDRMKTDLIRSVSHEFRTPLSAIVGMTEMILDGDIEEGKVKKYLNIILSEGIRMSNMVSNLLSIARIESGKEGLKFKSIDMKALLNSLTESFSSLVERKKALVKYDVDKNGNFVGDEEKIKQLLVNFLANSLAFSDNGCSIEIKVKRKNNNLEIVVSDNGWGIPKEDMPHLTQRFYRGREGFKTKGTGLGLALCSEIVKMHGGSMDIKSKLGKGTTIFVSLPYRRQSE